MSAKINHVAIVSDHYALSGKFYETLFGMKTAPNTRPESAVTVGDGHVGLNINPRKPGRPAGLDHFGIEVDEVEPVLEKLEGAGVRWLKRPGSRPFAGITTHDPDGNMFDLSHRDMENRAETYAEPDWEQDRTISHFAFRTMDPERCAEFYAELFGLAPGNREEGDPNYTVTDGRMTLQIMPWRITDFEGTGIVRPGGDHFGFRVESIGALKADMEAMTDRNLQLMPVPVGRGPEGKARLELFDRCCPLGTFQLSDVDCVLIDVAEA